MGLAAKMATTTIPIVVAALGNPVALGLVETEARPGGNLTGIMPYVKGLPAKQLELAREIVPGALQIGIVNWPAPGSEDTELGVLMELEVGHGETEVYPGVQA